MNALLQRTLMGSLLLVVMGGCKKSNPPAPPPPDATPSITDAGTGVVDTGAKRALSPKRDAGPRRPTGVGFHIARLAVSSRVENESEKPENLWDFDPDTAWSSKTGELEGAWVEMLVEGTGAIKSVVMTVGMTKSVMPEADDVFLQNPRIEEVALTWTPVVTSLEEKTRQSKKLGTPVTLSERFKLDPASREEQSIPIPTPTTIEPPGLLRLTVKKVKLGTKPSWREVSISEIGLLDAWTYEQKVPNSYGVGPIDPASPKGKPRGILDIVPEEQPAFGCKAYVPASPPRVYCIVGHVMRGGASNAEAELVSIEPTKTETIATLVNIKPQFVGEFIVPYGSWFRTEQKLREGGGRAIPRDGAKNIPWKGPSVEIEGVTFRQRETLNLAAGEDTPESSKGVVEVRWPGETAFKPILNGFPILATSPMTATVQKLGTYWLVERRMTHGSEGLFGEGAEATVCDFAKKTCTE